MRKLPKQKTCKGCKEKFPPTRPMQEACQPICAINIARAKAHKKAKAEKREIRRDIKVRKDKAKTLAQWLNEAQAVVNAYVRARDADKPCICCDRHHQGQYHAGHWLSRGAHPELRFNLWNIHKQASYCNNYKSGNVQEYRIKLIEKIGQDKVDWLEGPHEPAKFTVDYAKRIKQIFKKKLKRFNQ